jgi:hypothetical protein
MIKWYNGHGQNGHFDHDHLENPRVPWSFDLKIKSVGQIIEKLRKKESRIL